MAKPRVLILGGGFGGLFTTLDLAGWADVTLVSDEDHFLFTPMLYEYLSGEVEAWHIAPRFNELLDEKEVTEDPIQRAHRVLIKGRVLAVAERRRPTRNIMRHHVVVARVHPTRLVPIPDHLRHDIDESERRTDRGDHRDRADRCSPCG